MNDMNDGSARDSNPQPLANKQAINIDISKYINFVKGLAVNGENMRQVISDDIIKIRFPTMTHRDFTNAITR